MRSDLGVLGRDLVVEVLLTVDLARIGTIVLRAAKILMKAYFDTYTFENLRRYHFCVFQWAGLLPLNSRERHGFCEWAGLLPLKQGETWFL